MVKKIVSCILILCVMLLSFTGCFGKKKAGEPFTMPITDEPTSLDPQIADSNSEKLVAVNCFEGLVRLNEKGEISQGVAENWSVSSDGLTYTFNLRHDAHWAMFSGHKEVLGDDYANTFNTNVVADDFKFAIERTKNSQTGSKDASLFSAVSSIEAKDDYTIVFRLKNPDENFLFALTSAGAMPCDEDFFNATNGKYGLDAKYLLCNGPFHVSKWIEKTSIRMAKNNEYVGETKSSPSSLTLYYNNDSSEVAEKAGSLTYDAAFLSSSQFLSIEDTKDLNITEIPNVTYSFIFNHSDKSSANLNFRLAFCKAVNASAIIGESSDITPATGIVPASCKIGTESYNASGSSDLILYDETAAKSNFQSALLDLGATSIETSIICSAQYETVIKQLVQSLQKTLGVKFVVSVKTMTDSELAAAVNDGNYGIAFYPFQADTAFANEFLEGFSKNNVLGFSSPEFQKCIDEIHKNSDSYQNERSACQRAEKYLIDNAIIMPVFYENSYFVTSDKTSGIYFNSSADDVCFINARKK